LGDEEREVLGTTNRGLFQFAGQKEMIVWQVFNGGVSTVAQRYSDRRLRGPLGFIPKQPTLFQERPGLATRGYDSFSESEY